MDKNMNDFDLAFNTTRDFTKEEIIEVLEQVRTFFELCLAPNPDTVDLKSLAVRFKIDTLDMKVIKIQKQLKNFKE